MTRSALLSIALLATAVLGALPAHAAPPAPAPAPAAPADAETIYRQAQEHYLARRYAAALPLFQKLVDDGGSPNARLYVARCLRELGRLPEAYEEMDRTQREASERARREPRFASTRDAATTELAELRGRVGRVSITCSDRPAGLALTLNGAPLTASRLGSTVPVTPGRVIVVATAPGHEDTRLEQAVPAGSVQSIRVELRQSAPTAPPVDPPLAATAPSSSSPVAATPSSASPVPPPQPTSTSGASEPPPPADDGTPGTLTGGIVMVGLAVLGGVAWGVGWSLGEDRFDEVTDECHDQRCTDPAINDSIDEGRTMDYVATGGAALTVIGVVTGAILFTVYGLGESGDDPAPSDPPVQVGVTVGPSGGVVGLSGRF